MNDMRSIIELLEKKAYKVKSDGSGIDNFSVNRNDPKIQIKRLSNGEVYDLHYKDEKQLEKGLANEKGFERFDADNVEGNLSLPKNEKLAAIVKKYAKPGMTKEDLIAAENEAGSRSNTRIVLAHIAKSLGLEGVYNQKGSFIYMKNGEPASAAGGNLDQAKDVAEKGLLPDKVADKIQKVADKNKERDPEKAKKFQDVIDVAGTATGGDDGSDQDDGAGEDPVADKDDAGGSDIAAKIKAAQELLAKATAQATEESRTLGYADQLLRQLNEQLSGREAQELASIMQELEAALPDLTDDSQKQQIEALMRQYKEFQDGGSAVDDADSKDSGTGQIDTDSDSAMAAAKEDPESWIENELPKELEAAQAKGLMKATNRGKKKSASAAAVQTILMRIGTGNNNAELKKIKADGFYGPATIAGVKRAQELAGIKVDGDVGANSARELLAYSKDPQKGIDDSIKTDFARIKELVDKHNAAPEPINTSIDFSMKSMLETLSRLDEALDDAEMKELKALIDKHRPRMDDPEAGQQYSQEYRDLFKTADEITQAPAADKDEKEIDPPAKWEGNPDTFAQAIFDAGEGKMLGTDEDAISDTLGKLPNKQAYDAVEKAFATLSKFNTLVQSFEDEMNLRDRQQYVFPHFRRLGIEHSYGTIPGRDDAQKTANVKAINDKGGWAKQGSYDKDGKWIAGADAPKDSGGGASGYEYVGGPDRNGVAPQAEQDKNPDYIIAYWEGKKYYILPTPTADGQYKGSTRAGGQDATVQELAPAVKVEVERREKAGIKSNAKTGADPLNLANPKNAETPVGNDTASTPTGTTKPGTKSAGTNNNMAIASKDYSMKKPINEAASMNISMSGDNAGEVSELLKILKNAGMPDAAPVGAVDMPMDMPVPIKHDHEGPEMDSPCGSGDSWDNSPDETKGELSDIIKLSGGPNSNKAPGDIRVKDPRQNEEEVDEDGWDNSPDEEYKDDDYMYQSGGIHKKKKAYAKAQDGDNAMAVESIKSQLYKALEDKLQNK